MWQDCKKKRPTGEWGVQGSVGYELLTLTITGNVLNSGTR